MNIMFTEVVGKILDEAAEAFRIEQPWPQSAVDSTCAEFAAHAKAKDVFYFFKERLVDRLAVDLDSRIPNAPADEEPLAPISADEYITTPQK